MGFSAWSYVYWLIGWALTVAYLALLMPFYRSIEQLKSDEENSGEAHGRVYESPLGCLIYVVGILASAFWMRALYLRLNDPASSVDSLVRSILMMVGCATIGGAVAWGGAFQLSLMWNQKGRRTNLLAALVIGVFIGGAVYPLCAEYLNK